jgi:hypothetical protein
MDTAVLASGSDSTSSSRRPCLPRRVTRTSAHRGAKDLFTPRRLPYNPQALARDRMAHQQRRELKQLHYFYL